MSFLGRILRFLFWFLIVSWAVRLLGRAIRGVNREETRPTGEAQQPVRGGKRLVKDPICGMHLAEELALPVKTDGEVVYFCSEECRTKYERILVQRLRSA